MIEKLKQILNENIDENSFDTPYEREEDDSIPKKEYTRKKVLRLCDLNKLKKIRNQQREELGLDSIYVPILYGPDMSNPQNDGGMPQI